MDAKIRGPAEKASALHAEGKLGAAEKIYRDLVATEGSAQGFVGLGRVLLEQGRADQAFEVFSDDFGEMEAQALQIAGWGSNVYVKIPVTNTRRPE